VPGSTVERYRDRLLAALHEYIRREGSFIAHGQHFLVEAHQHG
jgi:hypothetical protein